MTIDSVLKYLTQHPVGFLVIATGWLVLEFFKVMSSKSFKKEMEANTQQHDEIFSLLDRVTASLKDISGSLDIDKTNRDYIKKITETKFFYLGRFKSDEVKNFACFKADNFIETISTILSSYSFKVNEITEIVTLMESNANYVKTQMETTFGKEKADMFIEHHKDVVMGYINDVTDIFLDTDNHHKTRFIKRSNCFLKEFMNALIAFEQQILEELK